VSVAVIAPRTAARTPEPIVLPAVGGWAAGGLLAASMAPLFLMSG
jgi:hypothetical protein